MITFDGDFLPLAKSNIGGIVQRWKQITFAGIDGVGPLNLGAGIREVRVGGRLPNVDGGNFQGKYVRGIPEWDEIRRQNTVGELNIHGFKIENAILESFEYGPFFTVRGTINAKTCEFEFLFHIGGRWVLE